LPEVPRAAAPRTAEAPRSADRSAPPQAAPHNPLPGSAARAARDETAEPRSRIPLKRGRRPTADDGEPEAKGKPKARRAKTHKMGKSPSPPSALAGDEAMTEQGDADLKVYEITLAPGADVMRRGINPLGVLDELRDLGETTVATDLDLVPPLDE